MIGGSNVGHWWTILRDPHGNAFIFDSLAKNPETYNKNIIQFLKNGGIKNIIVNKKKFQIGQKSQTCGRWAILLAALNKTDLNIDQIYKYLDSLKKQYGTYDNAVLTLVK